MLCSCWRPGGPRRLHMGGSKCPRGVVSDSAAEPSRRYELMERPLRICSACDRVPGARQPGTRARRGAARRDRRVGLGRWGGVGRDRSTDGRHGCRAWNGPGCARLLHQHLDRDDGRDDVPGDRADGGYVSQSPPGARRGDLAPTSGMSVSSLPDTSRCGRQLDWLPMRSSRLAGPSAAGCSRGIGPVAGQPPACF